jgi:hypothetical protein
MNLPVSPLPAGGGADGLPAQEQVNQASPSCSPPILPSPDLGAKGLVSKLLEPIGRVW